MNQLTLNMSFLNLNLKKLFCLDLGLDRPLALSAGQLPGKVAGLLAMDPTCVGSVEVGFDHTLSGEEEDKEARITQ